MKAQSEFVTVPEEDFSGWKKKTALFLSSQSASMFGSMLVQYAIIWHITLTTQSGAFLTIATIAAFLPQILVSLFAGVWADRYSRKFLIIASDALIAASTLVLVVLFLLGYRELWLLFVVSGIRSLGAGIQAPAVGALLPQIVPAGKLMKVNSINGTIQPFIMITAPVVSGALLAYARLEAIFMVDIVTAIIAIFLLLFLNAPALPSAVTDQKTGYLNDLKEGLLYIHHQPTIRILFLFFAFVFFLVTPAAFLTPLLVARSYGEEVWRLTANEVAFFLGSIIGGFILMGWGGFKNHFHTIGLSCIAWGFLFAGLGLTNIFAVYLALMFLSGIPMPFMNVATTTLLQEITDPGMLGRVFGVHQMIASIVMPLGMVVFGPIADRITIELVLVATSAFMAAPGVWILFNRKIKVQPRAPMDAATFEMQPGD